MAFQTGTATSFINLLDTLRLFATANGWTENLWAVDGANQRLHLQKGSIYTNFHGEASTLKLRGSLGYNGASAWNAQPTMSTGEQALLDNLHGAYAWPVTYWLFAHGSPDSIEMVVRYQPTRVQWLNFGAITKYINSAAPWTGGEFFAASYGGGGEIAYAVSNGRLSLNSQLTGGFSTALFQYSNGYGGFSASHYPRGSELHIEADSFIWGVNLDSSNNTTALKLAAWNHAWPLQVRTPSAFNGLSALIPIKIYALRPDAHYSPVGRIEHSRYCAMNNHNLADIIDIGGQKWMVFPWLEKAGITDGGSVQFGWAIKYDGP